MPFGLRWGTLADSPSCFLTAKTRPFPSTIIRKWSDSQRSSRTRTFSVPKLLSNSRSRTGTSFQQEKYYSGTRKPTFQSDVTAFDASRQVPELLDGREVIRTNSLADTLRAHREANENNIIITKRFTEGQDKSWRFAVPTEAKRLLLNRVDETSNERKEQDYTGEVKPLAFDWEIIGDVPRSLRLPWMPFIDSLGSSRDSSIQRLSREILAADAFLTPRQKELEAASYALNDIREAVIGILKKESFPSHLDLIGSRAAGFAGPASDLDLNISVDKKDVELTEKECDKLLGKVFKATRWSKKPTGLAASYFIPRARVPIAVGSHQATGLEYQIQCASSGYGSLEVMKGLAAEFPSIKALFRIVKQMLKIRNLNSGTNPRGGVTSYPLLNMLAVSLKMDTDHTSTQDTGEQLLRFLDLYSNFDFYKNGITHEPNPHFELPAGSLFKDEEGAREAIERVTQDPIGAVPTIFNVRGRIPLIWPGESSHMMCLHDPANPYNDLGRSTHMIKHVQATMIEIRNRLKQAMSDWDRRLRAEGEIPSEGPSLLAPLIEGDYTMFNMERRRLVEFAERQKR